MVVVTKNRHPVLTEELSDRLIQISRKVIEDDWKCRVLEINTDKDHVHIHFEASPQPQLSKLVNNYKTVTSRLLRKEFSSALEKYDCKDRFWSDSYFLSTVSETTEEAVRIYIQEQGKRDNEGYRRHTGRRKAANPA